MIFVCQQQGWSLSVELVIGGRGIRQRTQKDSAVSSVKFYSDDFFYFFSPVQSGPAS